MSSLSIVAEPALVVGQRSPGGWLTITAMTRTALQLGAHVGQQNMTMDEMRSLWRTLDANGMEWISAWDHLYEAPPAGGTIPHFEAVATLGAMAADTHNARLGCLVFYVGYRNPGLLAKAAVAIDHISGGRFEIGLGAGWHEWEAEAFGYDFPSLGTRFDMLDDATVLIKSLFTEERTTHHGPHFRAENASMVPGPVRGHIPLWIGGIGEKRTLGLVAREADGWNSAYLSVDEFTRLQGVLEQRCDEVGRDPATIEKSVNLMFNLGVDEASAARAAAQLAADWGPLADRIRDGALLGTPDQAVESILAYREAGADLVNIAIRMPVEPDVLDAYLTHTVPAVRAAAG